eukprot:TRINITY_DN37258_c0_g1_i1.p1 TRINITY_DN37258_c0_g1~~TRINITY_DN37258_c0_g1_i1.p1  ORF type:complete len:104 (+),score=4.06 TRINITY_DN37258_c0_g1_i1:341-652(+)
MHKMSLVISPLQGKSCPEGRFKKEIQLVQSSEDGQKYLSSPGLQTDDLILYLKQIDQSCQHCLEKEDAFGILTSFIFQYLAGSEKNSDREARCAAPQVFVEII